MKVGIASDHNGINEKKIIIEYLKTLNIDIIDFSMQNNELDDYPLFAFDVSKSVSNKGIDFGVLFCGTGIGMSIAANKVKGVRCAKVSNTDEASLARLHNNANVIALSYKMPIQEMKECIKVFLETNFSEEERHIRRIKEIEDYES